MILVVCHKQVNLLTADARRQCADIKDFLPGRLAQAKASCLLGQCVDIIAKRLVFLPSQVAEAKYFCARPRMSSERSEQAAN